MENQGCRPLMEECRDRAGHPAGHLNAEAPDAMSARAQLSCVRGLTAAQAYPCRSSSQLTYAVKVRLLGRRFIPGNWPVRPQISKPDYRPSNTILDAEFPDLLCWSSNLNFWFCCDMNMWFFAQEEHFRVKLCFDIILSFYPIPSSSVTAVATKIPSLPPINKRKRWVEKTTFLIYFPTTKFQKICFKIFIH